MLLIIHVTAASLSVLIMLIAVVGKIINRHREYDVLIRLTAAAAFVMVVTGVALAIVYHAGITSACLSGLATLTLITLMYLEFKSLRLKL